MAIEKRLADFYEEERFIHSPVAVNVRETEKSYNVEMAAPGFGKKDFKISMENGQLTVAAEREMKPEKKEDKFMHREFGYSSFMRSFNLPENTKESDVHAQYEDGILKVSIAKKSDANNSSKAIRIT